MRKTVKLFAFIFFLTVQISDLALSISFATPPPGEMVPVPLVPATNSIYWSTCNPNAWQIAHDHDLIQKFPTNGIIVELVDPKLTQPAYPYMSTTSVYPYNVLGTLAFNGKYTVVNTDLDAQINKLKSLTWAPVQNYFAVWRVSAPDSDATRASYSWASNQQWSLIVKNAGILAARMAEANFKGVIIDTEAYNGSAFFSSVSAMQNGDKGVTLENLQTYAFQRGQAFGLALWKAFPKGDVIVTWGHTAVVPLRGTSPFNLDRANFARYYDLLPAFLDGIIDARNQADSHPDWAVKGHYYDGFEQTYYARSVGDFQTAIADIKGLARSVAQKIIPKVYDNQVRPALGLRIDMPVSATDPSYRWTTTDWGKILANAVGTGVDYIWIYTRNELNGTTINFYAGGSLLLDYNGMTKIYKAWTPSSLRAKYILNTAQALSGVIQPDMKTRDVLNGVVDGIIYVDKNPTLYGWACQVGSAKPVSLQVYAISSGKDVSRILIGEYNNPSLSGGYNNVAVSSTPAIGSACGLGAVSGNLRFKIPLVSFHDRWKGWKIQVIAYAPLGSANTFTLPGPADLTIPAITRTVVGSVEGLSAARVITGWTCLSHDEGPLMIEVTSMNSAGAKQLLYRGFANVSSPDPMIFNQCSVASGNYRFRVDLSPYGIKAGKTVEVTAIYRSNIDGLYKRQPLKAATPLVYY